MDVNQLEYWHWFAAGLALLILETLIPAEFVLLWMGISATLVGFISWAFPTSWQAELVLFGVFSVISFLLYHRFRKKQIVTDSPTLNRRGESYVGRTFTLTAPIINGVGKLNVDDSQWRAVGPDLAAGSRVTVVKAEGATLKVERAQ